MQARTVFCFLSLFASASAFAADLALTMVPSLPVFTTAKKGSVFSITAAQDFEVASIWVVDLTNRSTGRPVGREAVQVKEQAAKGATKRLREFVAIVDPKLPPGYAFDGTLAIVYTSAGDKPETTQTSSVTRPFQVIRDGFNPAVDKPADASLNVVQAPVKLALKPLMPFEICVAPDKGRVIIAHVNVSSVTEVASGRVMDHGVIQLDRAPASVAPPAQICVGGRLSGTVPSDTFKMTAAFNIVYRADTAGAGWKSLPVNVEFSQPAAELRFANNGEARFLLTRPNPLAPYQEFATCGDYRTTPADALLPNWSTLRSAVTTNDAQHPSYPEDATLRSVVFPKGSICFTPHIPRSLTALRGKVLVLPPDVGKETELNPVFLVKDAWYWRFAAVLIAYGLALLLQWGTTHVRRGILHNGTRRNLADRLAQFLTARPDLANHGSVVLTRQLMADSVSLDRGGEFDLAEQNLQAAASRINDLIANPPATSTVLPAGTAIRVAQPTVQQIANRWLTLVVAQPASLNLPATLTWEILDAGNTVIYTKAGSNNLSLKFSFPNTGTYTIKVTSSAPSTPQLTRQVAIAPEPVANRFAGLMAIDWFTHGIALVLAMAAAYVATSAAESWGTGGDYFALVATAFGVGAGTQALRVTIGAVRGSG